VFDPPRQLSGHLAIDPDVDRFQSPIPFCQFAVRTVKFPVLIVFFVPHEIANELQIEYAIPLTRAMSHYREIKNATAEVVGVRLVKKTSTARAHAAIRDVIIANPTRSYQQIADLLGCSRWLIYRVAVEFNVRRPRGAGSSARRKEEQ